MRLSVDIYTFFLGEKKETQKFANKRLALIIHKRTFYNLIARHAHEPNAADTQNKKQIKN